MMEQQVITAEEAAHRAGVHARTLINAILRGRVKGHKAGPIWVVDPESLEEYKQQVRQRKQGRGGER